MPRTPDISMLTLRGGSTPYAWRRPVTLSLIFIGEWDELRMEPRERDRWGKDTTSSPTAARLASAATVAACEATHIARQTNHERSRVMLDNSSRQPHPPPRNPVDPMIVDVCALGKEFVTKRNM